MNARIERHPRTNAPTFASVVTDLSPQYVNIFRSVRLERSCSPCSPELDRESAGHGDPGSDLSDSSDLAKLEQILRNDSRVTLLVNNAGVGALAPLLNSDAADMSRMITLNVQALTRLTHARSTRIRKARFRHNHQHRFHVAIVPERSNAVYGGTKAFVLAFSRSLRHELANTGVTVQVVLPGATATDFRKKSGKPVEPLPQEIVMSAEDMVDAALSGLDQGEFVTIPALPDVGQWQTYEAARQTLLPNLSRARPAARYAIVRAGGGAQNVAD